MSRIFIGGSGLALLVGAVIGLLAGKGSWIFAIVGFACFFWGITSFWTRYTAARNALLAKHTFDNMDGGEPKARVTAKACEIAGIGFLEMMATFSPAQMYGFYALAMASLGVPPAISGEGWFVVGNPYTAMRGAEPEIASAQNYFRKKYGISMSFND